jgi:cell wall assembly regulator SMI1/predicted DNA-binding WGR domain protein
MSESIPIENLELSARSSDMLAKMGVTTVDELLAVAVIRAPKLVVAELREVLGELGIDFPGELVVDQANVETAKATGDVAARWKTIEAWLAKHHPSVLDGFNAPAKADEIKAAEKALALGRTLPEEYTRFLTIHDGQEEFSPMIGTCSLFSAADLEEEYENMAVAFDMEDEGTIDEKLAGKGVRPVQYSKRWIPIGRSARGRDFLCLDLDPAKGGNVGQIIRVACDVDDRPLVARSFADLLSVYFEALQTGEIKLDDDEDDEDEDEGEDQAPKAKKPEGGARYFEFVGGSSSKFWEIQLAGASLTTRYGKIGTDGQKTTKELASEALAQKECDKLVAEKTKKGYVEK